MSIVKIKIFKGDDEAKFKTFNVDPNPGSKSCGYMVGYIQALHDAGCETEVEEVVK